MEASKGPKYGVYSRVWWIGGRNACRKLELSQMKMSRRLLGASNTVVGVAVQGDLGWRKLEERDEGDVW